ncbi:hypothetical protein ACO1O0_007617 [Amphichorda felina]
MASKAHEEAKREAEKEASLKFHVFIPKSEATEGEWHFKTDEIGYSLYRMIDEGDTWHFRANKFFGV